MIQNIGRNPIDQLRRRVAKSEGSASTALAALSDEDRRLLRTLVDQPQDYIDNEGFYEDDAKVKIFDEAPSIRKPDASWYVPVMDDMGPRTRTTADIIASGPSCDARTVRLGVIKPHQL